MIYKLFPLLLLFTVVQSESNPFRSVFNAVYQFGKRLVDAVFPPDIPTDSLDAAWSTFENVRKYTTPEELAKRKEIFTQNFEFIKHHVNDFAEGKTTFQLRITALADLVLSEFNKLFNGYGVFPRIFNFIKPDFIAAFTGVQLPESVDWRERNAVTEVKDQQGCGSCYAFSSTGAIESHTFLKTNVLTELSPQNLVDCRTGNYSMFGCSGGYTDEGFRFVKDYGINTLEQYPYEAQENQCRFNPNQIAAITRGFAKIPEGDEKALAEAVATKGPVSVAIYAGLSTMQHYGKGVYYDENCKNTIDDLNHAVLVVGYGEENGNKYWLIKNSYGKGWGEEGYLKLAKDKNNHCGVATAAYYPIV